MNESDNQAPDRGWIVQCDQDETVTVDEPVAVLCDDGSIIVTTELMHGDRVIGPQRDVRP